MSAAETVTELRVLVGCLGEKGQANWWGSDFFSPTAGAFLAPIFTRSIFLAQYNGVMAAAAKVHDEVIGVGRTIHLFRLPIELEQSCQEVANNPAFVARVQPHLEDRQKALIRLTDLASAAQEAGPGPVLLGLVGDDIAMDLARAAGVYAAAFQQQVQSFPYLREAA
ncbi:MAG: hypothetical protein A3F78_11710 [Burkholderiales bacterium RIFCSPLOWO2_12_FULL_61_40]|nr:MAG: hypothetical protein A3F78_11710 [Burkholderiales bacterium RIFCSPLOWO2_12_FULL_61_40]